MAAQTQRRNLARQWAQAVMDRDVKAQYDLLSTQLQAAVYASYKAEHWVTGCSSPWVQSYEVSMNGERFQGKHQGGCGRSESQPPFYTGSLIIGSSISTVSPLMLFGISWQSYRKTTKKH